MERLKHDSRALDDEREARAAAEDDAKEAAANGAHLLHQLDMAHKSLAKLAPVVEAARQVLKHSSGFEGDLAFCKKMAALETALATLEAAHADA